jgi:hypothetical protein
MKEVDIQTAACTYITSTSRAFLIMEEQLPPFTTRNFILAQSTSAIDTISLRFLAAFPTVKPVTAATPCPL